MLYELSHFIKDRMKLLWEGIERVNSVLFVLRYRQPLKAVPDLLASQRGGVFSIREVKCEDCAALARFFASQPEDAFSFFKPHPFDAGSLLKLARRKSFLMFIALDGDDIVGYCFMRSFFNGQTYRGYFVDADHRRMGIAGLMGRAMNAVGEALHIRMFKSVSPENPASIAATESICDTEVVKTLGNGDLLIECFPKKSGICG